MDLLTYEEKIHLRESFYYPGGVGSLRGRAEPGHEDKERNCS